MTKRKVLAIWLDGYEQTFAAELMRAGELPALARLRERSARFLLEGGYGQRTGLSGEHLASGLSPEAAGRMAAVAFDPEGYTAWQEGAQFEPFAARLQARTVVFDPTYFSLDRAPAVQGLVAWGGHDPGTRALSRPGGVLEEVVSRFGAYPGKDWLYGFVWPSAERCRQMGDALAAATRVRAHAARWLLAERLPDWDLALVAVSELHSATEGLWHGVDPAHPLSGVASAPAAGDGLRAVYREVDALVGELTGAFPDATVVAFTLGGMGQNRSDLPSMVLLPELLYRHAFGRNLMRQRRDGAEGLRSVDEDEGWTMAMHRLLPDPLSVRAKGRIIGASAKLRRIIGKPAKQTQPRPGPLRLGLGWMPASRYQRYWPRMRAFALPSFYDGRVRLNLAGREARGIVPREAYEATCDEIEALLRACRDPRTCEPVVQAIERPGRANPHALGPTDSDIVVLWRGVFAAIEHPALGRIGPVPYRRPGGHTGPYGMAYVAGPSIPASDGGVRSAYDVVPTIVELLGEALPEGLSGESLLAKAAV